MNSTFGYFMLSGFSPSTNSIPLLWHACIGDWICCAISNEAMSLCLSERKCLFHYKAVIIGCGKGVESMKEFEWMKKGIYDQLIGWQISNQRNNYSTIETWSTACTWSLACLCTLMYTTCYTYHRVALQVECYKLYTVAINDLLIWNVVSTTSIGSMPEVSNVASQTYSPWSSLEKASNSIVRQLRPSALLTRESLVRTWPWFSQRSEGCVVTSLIA